MWNFIVAIINFCSVYFWPMYFISFGIYILFLISCVVTGEYDGEIEKILFFLSIIPIINYIIIIVLLAVVIWESSWQKIDDISNKRKKKYNLENENCKKQVRIFKKALVAGGYFKNEKDIIEFIEGYTIAQKLLGNEED